MFIYEFKETHNHIDIETRIYLDIENKNIIFYQYRFNEDKVLDTNCTLIPLNEFGKITKLTLKSYILLMQTNQLH